MFERLIMARQEQRIIETNIQLPMRFNILTDVWYVHAKIAANKAVNHSSNAGLGKEVWKNNVVSLIKEAEILSLLAASFLTTSSLNIPMG
jgi:hypothetical protein